MTTATFDIPITDDNILEGDEDFMITINGTALPPGVTPGDPDEATVTITDNDRKLMSLHDANSRRHKIMYVSTRVL